jgi:flavin reductase (DIM6/NTAB) family NADH-FMN oxidoreductase RutF
MIELKSEHIEAMETRYRAAFINSLGGFKSVVLLGTKSKDGQENLAIFNSLFHLGANPALCGVIVRPDASPRHTLQNIIETGFYTINHLNEDMYIQGHQTSARYPAEESEFEKTTLTPTYTSDFPAPFVQESTIRFACELQQVIPIEINGTTLLIGKIVSVSLPDDCIAKDGFIDIEKAGTITCSGLDSYHKTERLARLSYAKPDKLPQKI